MIATKKSIKINPAKLIINLLKRFNLVIFIIIIIGGLIFAILNLSSLLSTSSIIPQITGTSTSTQPTDSSTFDQATIDNLNKLTPAESNNPEIPSGRINPFSE